MEKETNVRLSYVTLEPKIVTSLWRCSSRILDY